MRVIIAALLIAISGMECAEPEGHEDEYGECMDLCEADDDISVDACPRICHGEI